MAAKATSTFSFFGLSGRNPPSGVAISSASPPTRPHIQGAGWSDERIPIPVAISRWPSPVRVARFLPCRGRASQCAAPALRPGRARSRTSPILVPSNARIRWSAYPSSGSSPWALLFSWPEHHLHATVLLVAEGFEHAGAVLKVNAMRHHERRVDLSFLDPA